MCHGSGRGLGSGSVGLFLLGAVYTRGTAHPRPRGEGMTADRDLAAAGQCAVAASWIQARSTCTKFYDLVRTMKLA